MDSDNGRGRDRPTGRASKNGGTEYGSAELADRVFRQFPYGILVLDGAGFVVETNEEAIELLGGPLDRAASCCNLFGCGRRDTPLAGGCLTELALARDTRLPEVRLDLTDGRGGAVWVTVAPLADETPRVVVQLRAADPRDRRRRTKPHWTQGPSLRVVALGRTRVESQEGPIGGAWLEQRPGQLLKYLVCKRERVVTVEELAEAFWPDAGRRALSSVRHYVHELRDRLEPERTKRTPSSFVVARQGGYTLDRNRVSIDVLEFEESIKAGLAAYSSDDRAGAQEHLLRGLELYCGDLFAEDPYEVWAMDERGRLRELASRALRTEAEIASQAGDVELAHEQLVWLAALEPYDMEAQRELIRSFIRRGRRSEAARRYSALRARMLQEFGEEPDFSLADLGSEPGGHLRLA